MHLSRVVVASVSQLLRATVRDPPTFALLLGGHPEGPADVATEPRVEEGVAGVEELRRVDLKHVLTHWGEIRVVHIIALVWQVDSEDTKEGRKVRR